MKRGELGDGVFSCERCGGLLAVRGNGDGPNAGPLPKSGSTCCIECGDIVCYDFTELNAEIEQEVKRLQAVGYLPNPASATEKAGKHA